MTALLLRVPLRRLRGVPMVKGWRSLVRMFKAINGDLSSMMTLGPGFNFLMGTSNGVRKKMSMI